MKAACWYGKLDVRVENAPLPKILNRRDAIIKVRLTAIGGQDMHLYNGVIGEVEPGQILGQEFMGEVVEVGNAISNLKTGDRVVVPCVIACGQCFFCQSGLHAHCDNANPNIGLAKSEAGHPLPALFGYSRPYGGYAGGQAEYVRVPFADVGPMIIPDELPDEQALFLSSVLPAAYAAAECCQIRHGDVVAVWGAGPVGQLAIRCAFLFGAERVIAIEGEQARLEMASVASGAERVLSGPEVPETLEYLTGGRGPDACIDAVGFEAHRTVHDTRHDQSKKAFDYSTAVPHVLEQAVQACRKGGVISVVGHYGGVQKHFPFGAAYAKGLSFRTGLAHVHKLMPALLERVLGGEIEPSFIITHRLPLADAANGYGLLNEKKDGCVKIIMKP
jgi:threonine dehydrogenase-like Zn-dependent dehydrogenase